MCLELDKCSFHSGATTCSWGFSEWEFVSEQHGHHPSGKVDKPFPQSWKSTSAPELQLTIFMNLFLNYNLNTAELWVSEKGAEFTFHLGAKNCLTNLF